MSSRGDTLPEHPLPPLRVQMELIFLLSDHGSGGVHGVWVGDLLPAPAFTQSAFTPAFLTERVLAGSAMYDPGQVFQCCMPNGEEPLVRVLCL